MSAKSTPVSAKSPPTKRRPPPRRALGVKADGAALDAAARRAQAARALAERLMGARGETWGEDAPARLNLELLHAAITEALSGEALAPNELAVLARAMRDIFAARKAAGEKKAAPSQPRNASINAEAAAQALAAMGLA